VLGYCLFGLFVLLVPTIMVGDYHGKKEEAQTTQAAQKEKVEQVGKSQTGQQ